MNIIRLRYIAFHLSMTVGRVEKHKLQKAVIVFRPKALDSCTYQRAFGHSDATQNKHTIVLDNLTQWTIYKFIWHMVFFGVFFVLPIFKTAVIHAALSLEICLNAVWQAAASWCWNRIRYMAMLWGYEVGRRVTGSVQCFAQCQGPESSWYISKIVASVNAQSVSGECWSFTFGTATLMKWHFTVFFFGMNCSTDLIHQLLIVGWSGWNVGILPESSPGCWCSIFQLYVQWKSWWLHIF